MWDGVAAPVPGQGKGVDVASWRGIRVHSQNIRPFGRALLSAAIAALCCVPVQSAWTQAQVQVPPGATPGANVPRDTERMTSPPEAPPDIFSVPRKLDRPVGADEGPRVRVQRFELSGAADRDDAGIKVADITALLEKQRAAQPADGFTIVQLEGVAEEITKYYRSRGLLLAQAFVPVQEVSGGVVKVGVLEGKLGDVTVEGNKRYSTRAIQDAFAQIVGEPVNQLSAEKALFTLNDYPGLDVYGVFQPGKEIGSTTLAIQVRREDPMEYYVAADNFGPDSTGQYRLRAGVLANSPFGYGDQINAYAIYSLDPSDSNADSLFGGFEYSFPMARTYTRYALRYSTSDYNVGGEFSDFSGKSYIGEAEGNFLLKRTRTNTSRLFVTAATKKGEVATSLGSVQEDEVLSLTARFETSMIDTRFRGVNRIELAGTAGDVTNVDPAVNTRYNLSPSFIRWNVSLERWQRLGEWAAVVINGRGQLSNDRLTSFDQVAIGGPENVRGYRPATFFADEAGAGSAELILEAPGFHDRKGWKDYTWGQMLKFHLYVDYAYAKVNGVPKDSATLTRDEDFSSFGGGVSFELPGTASARFDVARPFNTDDEILDGVAVKSETQFFFTVGYSF